MSSPYVPPKTKVLWCRFARGTNQVGWKPQVAGRTNRSDWIRKHKSTRRMQLRWSVSGTDGRVGRTVVREASRAKLSEQEGYLYKAETLSQIEWGISWLLLACLLQGWRECVGH